MTTNSSTQQRYLTQNQLCARWDIERTTLWRWRKAGLPTISVGRLVRFDVEAADAWILGRSEQAS